MYLQVFTLFGTFLIKKRRKNGAINFNAMIENSFSFKLNGSRSHLKKDGSYPIMLVVRKDGQRKTICLPISASFVEIKDKKTGRTEIKSQWNEKYQRYEIDGRKKDLHPDSEKLNTWLDEQSVSYTHL